MALRWPLLALLLLALPRPSAAEGRAEYEAAHLKRAMDRGGLRRAVRPEGKPIAFVRLYRNAVFIDEEPFPTLPNLLHMRTRPVTITRELLVREGALFSQALVDESMRNLRGLGLFSLVVIVAVQADDPSHVGLLVVTRDLWSLRFEQSFQFNNGQFDDLQLSMTERNLFGLGKIARATFSLAPQRYGFGQSYTDPRVLGRRLRLVQSSEQFFERGTDRYLGYRADAVISRPFYSLDQRWGFSVPMSVQRREIQQLGPNGQVQPWLPTTLVEAVNTAVAAVPTDAIDADLQRARLIEGANALALDRRFTFDSVSLSALARHQVPGTFTHRLSAGVGLSAFSARPAGEIPAFWATEYDQQVVPRDQTLVFPTVGWGLFERRFARMTQLASYGVTEDVTLGPFAGASLALPLTALGSTRSSIRPKAYFGWTEAPGRGLIEGALAGEASYEQLGSLCEATGAAPTDDWCWTDVQLLARVRFASPQLRVGRLGVGRLVGRADYLSHLLDRTARPVVSLGGGNGLRGYPSQSLIGYGKDRARLNLEYRAPPFVWSYLHVGAVAFYDAGSVHDSLLDPKADTPQTFEQLGFAQSVGLGFRLLMPQFNRTVFRFDLGVPLDSSGLMVRLSAGSAQLVPLPGREDLVFENTVGGLPNQP